MPRKTVVILHGSYGSADENWFPWLAQQVRDLGHWVVIPSFPTPHGQSLDAWKKVFTQRIGSVHSDIILVGHSLGATFALSILNEAAQNVSGTFLVSVFKKDLGLEAFDNVNKSFVEDKVDWNCIKRNAGFSVTYAGNDDPYVPWSFGSEIAENIGSQFKLLPNGGHINAASGFDKFPMLLEDMKPLLRVPKHSW